MDFKEELQTYQSIINNELQKYLRKEKGLEEILHQSMEYSLMAYRSAPGSLADSLVVTTVVLKQ